MSNRTIGNLQLAKAKISIPGSEAVIDDAYDANLQAIDTSVSALQDAGPGGGSGVIQSATVTLSAAQLKALNGTPVQIIAAPGTGKIIVPVMSFLQYKFGTVAYQSTNQAFSVTYMPTKDYSSAMVVNQSGFMDALASQVVLAVGSNVNIISQVTTENTAVGIGLFSDSADMTDGDGTLTVTVYYSVVTLQ